MLELQFRVRVRVRIKGRAMVRDSWSTKRLGTKRSGCEMSGSLTNIAADDLLYIL